MLHEWREEKCETGLQDTTEEWCSFSLHSWSHGNTPKVDRIIPTPTEIAIWTKELKISWREGGENAKLTKGTLPSYGRNKERENNLAVIAKEKKKDFEKLKHSLAIDLMYGLVHSKTTILISSIMVYGCHFWRDHIREYWEKEIQITITWCRVNFECMSLQRKLCGLGLQKQRQSSGMYYFWKCHPLMPRLLSINPNITIFNQEYITTAETTHTHTNTHTKNGFCTYIMRVDRNPWNLRIF